MKRELKKIPKFRNEDEERAFWSKHDATEYIDWDQAEQMDFPDLKPSVKSISIRLPQSLLNDLKTLANKKDVPYQSLMKMYLASKVSEEMTPYKK